MMEASLEEIISWIEQAVPGAEIAIVANESPSQQRSLLIDAGHAVEIARFIRDDARLRMDYASNVTGVDWLDAVLKEKIKVKKQVEGLEQEVEEVVERTRPGYLEAVYHLFSMEKRHGPLILRMRTIDRVGNIRLPSLTPIWRGAELQEREIYDLYGIIFEGHPDLRRLLMWDGFEDHPMRKDYMPPDDFEYEPTPHDEVLDRAKSHYSDRGRN